ncbi:MAG: glycosyltransferase [Bacteroidetes bacterium]|nr:glycosyltransferase [Bacteroidota bacterium]
MNRICTSLSQAGYTCVLVGRVLPDSRPVTEHPYIQKRLKCWFHRGPLFYLEYNLRLFLFFLFLPVDTICSIDADTVGAGLLAARLRRKNHVFDAHELFTEVPEVANRKTVKKLWGWLQKLAFRHTDKAYTVGSELAQWFTNTYHVQVEVVRNAPLLSRQIPWEPDTERFILYQGALNAGRGLEAMLQAMCVLNCKLVLAGEGDLSLKLRKMASDLGVTDKVQFLGFVPPAELPALTARAWIGLNVSENAGLSYYLSLNNKFFDYVHAGLPSLINPFPEYKRLLTECEVGILTEAHPNDLTKNATLLLTNEELHRKLRLNCNLAAQKWNWEQESLRLLDIYGNLKNGQ